VPGEVDLIAAQGVVRLESAIGRLNLAAAPRVAVVVEDDLAVEIVVDRSKSDCHALNCTQR
jgi:hypothetical protein